jgi:octopine/nopaline transport system substrate-binding protein
VKCKLIAQDWDGIIPGLQAGKFDAIMDGMSITAERRQVIDFSRPYASTPATFIAARSGPLANLPGGGQVIDLGRSQAAGAEAIAALRKALKGRTIGVQVATIHANFLDRYFKDVATIREYKTTDEQDLDLIAGRIDAALGDTSYFVGTLAKPEGHDLVLTGAQFDGGEIFGDGVGIGLRKRDADLRARFDEAIDAAHADGTLRRLSLKWFKLDTAPR